MRDTTSPVVFAELIDQLRRDGFVIGTSHYLRLQQLLPHVADLSPEQIRTVLCPVFARNAEEQERFYRVYDDVLSRPIHQVRDGGDAILPGPPAIEARRSPRAWKSFVVTAAGAILVVAIAFLLRMDEPPRQEGGGNGKTTQTAPPSTTVMNVPAVSVERAVMRAREHPVLAGAAIVLMIALATEMQRSFSRIFTRRRHGGTGGPFVWPLRSLDTPAPQLFTSAVFLDAARLLRERESSGRLQLDLARTVRASARAFGYITPVYRETQRPPEYVMLIERRGARDHLAAYFDAMADALLREGVLVERANFTADPRRAAHALRQRYPEHRVILCAASPAVLLDPLTGEVASWVDATFRWQQWALLVAADAASISRRAPFAVAEATTEGIRAIAEWWQLPAGARLRADTRLPVTPGDLDPEVIRSSLSPVAAELLLRCAAHTLLEWPLTCALLPAKSEMEGAAEPEHAMLELARLAWFRCGSLPPHYRERLVAELNARPDAVAVREIVVRTLRDTPPPVGSAAARAREVALLSQRLFVDRLSTTPFRTDARALRRYPLEMVRADGALMALLREAPATRVWRHVPVFLRRLVFPSASPALGARPFAGIAPLIVLAMILFLGGALTRGEEAAPQASDGADTSGGSGDTNQAGDQGSPPPTVTQPEPFGTDTVSVDTMVTFTASTETSASSSVSPSTAAGDGPASGAPTIFRADDLFIPAVTPPPASTATTETAASSTRADTLPAPVLRMPVGRIDVAAGTSGPIDFHWTPYGAYTLMVWKGAPAGAPIYTMHVRGLHHTWRPENLDVATPYSWTLRAPNVPTTLEPQTFMLNPVAIDDLLARDKNDQLRRSRTATQQMPFQVPCGQWKDGDESFLFYLGKNEVLVGATAEVTDKFQLDSARAYVTTHEQNEVRVSYSFRASVNVECKVPGGALIKVTAVIGPRVR